MPTSSDLIIASIIFLFIFIMLHHVFDADINFSIFFAGMESFVIVKLALPIATIGFK